MKLAIAAALVSVAACGGNDDSSPQPCQMDTDCPSGDVCAHTELCYPAAQVHAVTVHWTIGGQPASSTTCGSIDNMDVSYGSQEGDGDFPPLTFSPVACVEGEFPIDKWPIGYDVVNLEAYVAGNPTTGGSANIPSDPTADVTVDMPAP